jgi:hypothetical protein
VQQQQQQRQPPQQTPPATRVRENSAAFHGTPATSPAGGQRKRWPGDPA